MQTVSEGLSETVTLLGSLGAISVRYDPTPIFCLQCATVSMVCATAASMVTEPVSASLPTRAPGVTHVSDRGSSLLHQTKEMQGDVSLYCLLLRLHWVGWGE